MMKLVVQAYRIVIVFGTVLSLSSNVSCTWDWRGPLLQNSGSKRIYFRGTADNTWMKPINKECLECKQYPLGIVCSLHAQLLDTILLQKHMHNHFCHISRGYTHAKSQSTYSSSWESVVSSFQSLQHFGCSISIINSMLFET